MPPAGSRVLGREQPVVTVQLHPAAHRHGLAQQAGAQPACRLSRNRRREEHPSVRAYAGPGYLQRDGDLQRPRGLDVHQRVGQRIRPVEVGGQPPGPVTVQQRVQPDVHLAFQVRGEHAGRQRQEIGVLVPHPLRQPPRTAGTQPPFPVRGLSYRIAYTSLRAANSAP
jgi:hypothetical protein